MTHAYSCVIIIKSILDKRSFYADIFYRELSTTLWRIDKDQFLAVCGGLFYRDPVDIMFVWSFSLPWIGPEYFTKKKATINSSSLWLIFWDHIILNQFMIVWYIIKSAYALCGVFSYETYEISMDRCSHPRASICFICQCLFGC